LLLARRRAKPVQAEVLADSTVAMRQLCEQLETAQQWEARARVHATALRSELDKQARNSFPGEPEAKRARSSTGPAPLDMAAHMEESLPEVLARLSARLPGLQLSVCASSVGSHVSLVRVSLAPVMHGFFLVRRLAGQLVIENVAFRGLNEELDEASPWAPSVHDVFGRVSRHAAAAALHFATAAGPQAFDRFVVTMERKKEEEKKQGRKEGR
jgi:hypothetical protein